MRPNELKEILRATLSRKRVDLIENLGLGRPPVARRSDDPQVSEEDCYVYN